MTSYITRRLLQAVLVLILVTIVIFLMMRLLPGDPVLLYISQSEALVLTDEQIEAFRVEHGLDKPLVVQYTNWMSGLFHGDLGTSIVYLDPVGQLLVERIPVTVHLGLLAFILSTFFGILAGIICAIRRGGPLDTIVTSIANFGISVPHFWLGILLIYFFAFKLGWLPIYGYTSPFEDFWLSTRQLILPVLCLSVLSLASNTRQTRSSMLEVIRQDYIRTAWSKGLTERVVVSRHMLKNGLIPVITLIGMHIRAIFGGQVLIETVFNIPGMGRLLVNAVLNHDYPVVQGITLVLAVIVVLANLAVDISYTQLDPRIRFG